METTAIGQANPAEDRQLRDLESIIEGARTIADRVGGIANRLRDMRRRLLGMDDCPDDGPKVKEVVGSELSDLRQTLRGIDISLESIEEHVGNLESI